MLLDKERNESSHQGRKRSRTLPTAPKDSSRSKSLPKSNEQAYPPEKSRESHLTKAKQSLSQSTHTLSKQGLVKAHKEDSGEVPVTVDDVTKWISGVNGSTTCQDIIRVILERETVTFQASHVRKYVLCERWKKVERPLRQSAKILNIWNAWGQDRSTVRFVLKRIKKERKPVGRTDSKLWRKQQSGANSDTRHPAAMVESGEKRERKNSEKNQSEVNDIIKKILKQQTHLRSHLKRLEKGSVSTEPEPSREPSERHSKGKGYILKTFLHNVAESSEDFYSHDSGIGSALATITDCSITHHKDNEFKSFDTILDGQPSEGHSQDELSFEQLSELIKEYEKIIDINDKIRDNEQQIKLLDNKIVDVNSDISKKEIEDLSLMSEMASLKEDIEQMIQVNSKMSHDIKRNDVSLSHMVKNFEGRKAFLNTIELDINRAESYGKRLQKEFEREYETVDLCQNILSASEEDDTNVENTDCDTKDTHDEVKKESKLSEKCHYVDDAGDKIDVLSILPSQLLNASFTISATQNPFGI